MDTETKLAEMETKISDLERKLKAALRQDDELEVPMPMRGSLISTFRGEMTKYAIITWCFLLVFAIVAVVCGVAFFESSDVKMQIFYMVVLNIAIMQTVLMKLWYWLVWNRYSVVREVKRLELRIAELIEKSEN